MNKQKTAINLIRSIMRLSGKSQVWNNLYYNNTRTVKCYRDKDCNKDMALQSLLHQTLNDLNIVHQIKFTEPMDIGPWNPGTGGFIVRLPSEV